MSHRATCPYCEEAAGAPDAYFRAIYPEVSTRRVAESANLFVIPTVGQLFSGSLLVVSKHHLERFAEVPKLHEEIESLVAKLIRYRGTKNVLKFEHGALSSGRAGCGIYHAHLHLVPLPSSPNLHDLIGRQGNRVASIRHGWRTAQAGRDYLVAELNGEVSFLEADAQGFGSQFMRRRIVSYFGLKGDWNWRSYSAPEDMVKETMVRWRGFNALS